MQAIIQKRIAASIVLGALVAAGTVAIAGQADAQGSNEGALIINEFNAVGATKYLEDGNFDPAFGGSPALGNGGDWMELVVTAEDLDIRGWTIDWANDDPDVGTVTFTNNGVWQHLKAGTIITIRAGVSSNTSFNCATGDWLLEVGAGDTNLVTQTGHSFKVDNDGWRASIVDDNSDLVQDFVGEPTNGVIWAGSGINSREVGKLEEDPSAAAADLTANYQDGNCSSFGAPNCWNDGASAQSFAALRSCP